ncbi:hypothetical protein [Mesorhizobium sp.]|uniref:hypothetical protein n=1 Tax=Mesorhizobium sp. TaxID=1871066 RepID=UPI0025BC4EE4|nr:hypothetical protein [Mesorhizobium sp.]
MPIADETVRHQPARLHRGQENQRGEQEQGHRRREDGERHQKGQVVRVRKQAHGRS